MFWFTFRQRCLRTGEGEKFLLDLLHGQLLGMETGKLIQSRVVVDERAW